MVWSPWAWTSLFSYTICNAGVAGTCSFLNPHQKGVSSEREYWHVPIAVHETDLLFLCQQPTGCLSHYKYSIIRQRRNWSCSFFPANINFSRTKNWHRGEWSWSVLALSFAIILMEELFTYCWGFDYSSANCIQKYTFGANNSCQYPTPATRKHQGLNCSVILFCHSWM